MAEFIQQAGGKQPAAHPPRRDQVARGDMQLTAGYNRNFGTFTTQFRSVYLVSLFAKMGRRGEGRRAGADVANSYIRARARRCGRHVLATSATVATS